MTDELKRVAQAMIQEDIRKPMQFIVEGCGVGRAKFALGFLALFQLRARKTVGVCVEEAYQRLST